MDHVLTRNLCLESIKNFQSPVIIQQIIPLQNGQKTARNIPLRRINIWEISTWKDVQDSWQFERAHSNHSAVSCTPIRMAKIKKKKKITQNPGDGVEKLVHSHIDSADFNGIATLLKSVAIS